MAYLGFAGASGFLAFSTTLHNPLLAMLSVGMASFSNDLVMPERGRGRWTSAASMAGSLAGAMNMLGNMAAPYLAGHRLHPDVERQQLNLTFYLSAAVYLMGIVCWRSWTR